MVKRASSDMELSLSPYSRQEGSTGDFSTKGYKSDEEKAEHTATKSWISAVNN